MAIGTHSLSYGSLSDEMARAESARPHDDAHASDDEDAHHSSLFAAPPSDSSESAAALHDCPCEASMGSSAEASQGLGLLCAAQNGPRPRCCCTCRPVDCARLFVGVVALSALVTILNGGVQRMGFANSGLTK